MNIVLGLLMASTSAFLILIVLLQKGKGGGLTGALGGMGGESAFGSKAGDAFTRVTMGTAVFWILLCMFSIRMLNTTSPLEKAAAQSGTPSIIATDDAAAEDATAEDEAAADATSDDAAPAADATEE